MHQPTTTTTTTSANLPDDTDPEAPTRWAGVDWSWSDQAVCVVDDTGAAVERFTVPNTTTGLSTMVTTLHRHRVTGVAIERGDGPVVAALLAAGLTVFVIVARQVSALRTRYSTAGNKDDRFDAYLLADVLRTDRRRLIPLTVDTDATVGLRMLIRTRADLVKARVAAHNQLRAHLQLAHPGAVGLFHEAHLQLAHPGAVGLFHELAGTVSLAFLERFPTPRHAAWLSEKRLATWLRSARYTRSNTRTAAQLLDHLRQAPPGHPDGPAADSAQVITTQLVALLRSLKERITIIETHIEQALDAHTDGAVFTSLPRSGRVRAATLLAEIGDARGRYPTDDALAAAAGISPSTRASGRSHYVAFRRGCNYRLRQALVDFADGSRAGHPWAQNTYARARARGHNHAHAIRILARAWLRIIWRCWTENTPYDPDRHAAAVTARDQRTTPAGDIAVAS
ncbi:IS110 family transposase [Pseudonocardia sp. ICBG162]|uniref:IS110 family transposase n=1 Tax=Pseudonocardia sp. ICBG162 TaxID=2846761 RepID=UPI001CF6A7BD|nr:IS110 family transposase [Pseudonocardia sp. ICBG162]